MNVGNGLRTAAIAMACVGALDPTWNVRRHVPVPVDLRITTLGAVPDDHDNAWTTTARQTAQRLVRDLDGDVSLRGDADPVAIVLIGRVPDRFESSAGVPVSTVSLTSPAPNVRIIAASNPAPVPAGWRATVNATFEAKGLKGRESEIVLEQQGAVVARLEHRWSGDSERFDAAIGYAPPAEGTSRVTVRARPLESEFSGADNAADLQIVAGGKRLEVLVYEPRPSWASAFVRRALETDPVFNVSAVARTSRGVQVRAGRAPSALSGEALTWFDAVVVGAPEELRPAEIQALRAFASVRGGAVVLVPDRRPSGSYVSLIPGLKVDELLVENPIEMRLVTGPALRASELVITHGDVPGADVLVSIERANGERRPVVMSWPVGAGQVVFSGALDAWRYRARPDHGFDQFWRSLVGEVALASPAPIEVTLDPGIARPGDEIELSVRLRRTEYNESAAPIRLPAVRARIIGASGMQEFIRLWPTAETGAFEGRITAPPPGRYDVQISADGGAVADRVLLVDSDVRAAVRSDDDVDETLRLVAAATGGVAANAQDLGSLERHLRSLGREQIEVRTRPARSAWFVIAFVVLLAAEWMKKARQM
jgi:hypothetical protein